MSIATFPFDPQAADLGIDVQVTTDLAPVWGIASGKLNLACAIVRRLTTPRGGLFYDPDYGLDVRSYLNAGFTQAGVEALRASIVAEVEKDPRVDSCGAEMVFNFATGRMSITLTVLTADGPFDLVLAATNVTVELLAVDGVLSPSLAPPLAPVAIIVPVGDPGPPGPAGAGGGGGGGGGADVEVDDDRTMADSTTAEVLAYQELVDFDPLPATVTVAFTAEVLSASGTATFRLRVGGTDGAADGTVVATTTTASPTYVQGTASATISNPTGKQLVKITLQAAAVGQDARLKSMVLTIR